MGGKRKGVLFTVLASLMFGLSPVFTKLVLDYANIETANVLLAAFASVFFLAYFLASKKTWHLLIIKSNWRKIGLLGLLDAAGSLLFAYGVLISGPTSAAFIIQFTTIFSILFGIVFLAERFSKWEILGVLTALGGLFFLACGNAQVELVSTVAVLTAALLFATVNLFSKYFVQNIPPFSLAGGRAFFIFLYLAGYALILGKLETAVPAAAVAYSVLGALTGMVLSFVFFFKALETWEISKTAALRTMEPFLTAVFSLALLSLAPTVNQLAGGALIVVGVAVLSLTREKTSRPKKETTDFEKPSQPVTGTLK
ncbi:MAG: DMT family transporter [Candidatus Bathyarchaeota archaeon]|nr:DMT family transporter [Candidatus Bathyarchaeota archaeon]